MQAQRLMPVSFSPLPEEVVAGRWVDFLSPVPIFGT
jgi:hypothetical protein